MISGERAFRGETSADTLSAILKEDAPELSEAARNAPPALERIVRNCLEKDPEQRFQSASDVAINLEALTGTSTTGTTGKTGEQTIVAVSPAGSGSFPRRQPSSSAPLWPTLSSPGSAPPARPSRERISGA